MFTLCRTHSVQFIDFKYLFPYNHQTLADRNDWITSILSRRNVIVSSVQHHFLKVCESLGGGVGGGVDIVVGIATRYGLEGSGNRIPSPTSAEVKERVELFLYSPSGPSWSVLG
jgi:hypothetical protein